MPVHNPAVAMSGEARAVVLDRFATLTDAMRGAIFHAELIRPDDRVSRTTGVIGLPTNQKPPGSRAVSAGATALTRWAEQRQADALTGLKQASGKFRTAPAFRRN